MAIGLQRTSLENAQNYSLSAVFHVLLSTLFSSPRLKVFVQRSSFAPFKLFAFVRAAIWQKSPFKQD